MTVLNGFLRAHQEGTKKYGVKSKWVFCFLRDRPLSGGLDAYEAARPWAELPDGSGLGLFHAVGLAANEFEKPPMLFEEAFRRAKKDGLHVTMHCDVDQKDAADHVHEAIFQVCDSRGAERIDHGLNVLDRPELIAGVKERDIGLTLCPHAYHRRQATDVLFPKIKTLIDKGVKLCINSDDPTYMHDVWIDGNIQKVYTYCDLEKRDIVQLARNAVDMCWADEDVKKELMNELDELRY
jgi:adenosine deaminase